MIVKGRVPMDKILYIIIPAYNEEVNIKQVIEDWYPIVEKCQNKKSRLVIIDDGSKDRTFSILQEVSKDKPLLVPITKENSGHGATLLYGYQYALEHGAEYIFQTDSDGQTLATEFKQFWDIKDEYDLITGYRNDRKDGFFRILVMNMLIFVIYVFFGVRVKDANAPFRLMKAEILKENLKYVPKDFNLTNAVLTAIYAKKKQGIKYIPITFRARQGGENSINLKRILGIGVRAIKDFREVNRKMGTSL